MWGLYIGAHPDGEMARWINLPEGARERDGHAERNKCLNNFCKLSH